MRGLPSRAVFSSSREIWTQNPAIYRRRDAHSGGALFASATVAQSVEFCLPGPFSARGHPLDTSRPFSCSSRPEHDWAACFPDSLDPVWLSVALLAIRLECRPATPGSAVRWGPMAGRASLSDRPVVSAYLASRPASSLRVHLLKSFPLLSHLH